MANDAATEEPPTAESLKARANALYKSGNYAGAVELYTEAHQLTPMPTLILNRAAAHLMLRHYRDALADAREVLAAEPLNAKAAVRTAKALCGMGNVEEAQAVLKESKANVGAEGAKEIEKELITVSRLLHHLSAMKTALGAANYHTALSSLESAMAALDHTLKPAKDSASLSVLNLDSDLSAQPHDWLLLRARLLLVLGDIPAAQQAANHALTKFNHPTSAALLHLRALALYLFDTAASSVPALLQRALQFDPDHKPSFQLLRLTKRIEAAREEGKIAFGKNEWLESIKHYTMAASDLREALAISNLGWWTLDSPEPSEPASLSLEDETAEREAYRGGLVRVKCLSNISTAQSKLAAYSESVASASDAIALLSVLSFATSYKSAHAEEMRGSVHSSLFSKLHLRLADSQTKLNNHAEAVRAYTVAEGINPTAEIRSAKRAAAKREKEAKRKDWYAILGLDRNCNDDEIRKAYRKAALMYHPDKQATLGDEEKAKAEEKFKEVSEAYNVLIDPQKRRMFDSGADMEDGMDGMGGMGGFGGGVDVEDMLRMFMGQQGGMGGGGFPGGFGGGFPGGGGFSGGGGFPGGGFPGGGFGGHSHYGGHGRRGYR